MNSFAALLLSNLNVILRGRFDFLKIKINNYTTLNNISEYLNFFREIEISNVDKPDREIKKEIKEEPEDYAE